MLETTRLLTFVALSAALLASALLGDALKTEGMCAGPLLLLSVLFAPLFWIATGVLAHLWRSAVVRRRRQLSR